MISYIEGQILFIESNAVVVKTQGLGYQIYINKRTQENLLEGGIAALFTYTHVREDSLELYGFLDRQEKQIFLLLISVSGIGPKLALAILSAVQASDLIHALLANDINKLLAIPGVGKKTAERLILELKDKALKIDVSPPAEKGPSQKTNLLQALKSLGYSKSQSDGAVGSLDQYDFNLPLEELIKKTLNVLAGTKGI
jgi:holliday junction DNA helicase RuvA